MRRFSFAMTFVCLALLISTTASAVQLNAAFGAGGMTLIPIDGDFPEKLRMARQSSGSLVLSYISEDADSNRLTRLLILDSAGAVSVKLEDVQITGYWFEASNIALDASDNIYLAGTAFNLSTFDTAFAVVRLTPAGVLDTTFGGGDGSAVYFDDFSAKVLTGLLVDGSSIYFSGSQGLAGIVARLTSAGALDTGFDGDGILPFSGLEAANGLTKTGANIAAAAFDNDTVNVHVWRFSTTGVLDATFGGGDGKTNFALTNLSVFDPFSIVADASGNLFVTGEGAPDVNVAKLMSGGDLDSTFGIGGIATADFLGGNDFEAALAVDSTGKPLVLASADSGDFSLDNEFGLFRFTTTGVLDGTFGVGGMFGVDVFGFSDNAQDMILSGSDLFVAGFIATTDFESVGSEEMLGVVKLDTSTGSTGGKNFIVQNQNTGFEQSASGTSKAFAWKGTNLTSDARKCNKPNKNKFYSFTGNCAFVFAGGAGENSTIKQTLSNFGATIIDAGEALDYSMMVQAASKLKLKVKIKLVLTAGGSETLYNNSFVSPDPAYTHYVGGGDTATHEVKKVVISINNKATGGKTNVDNFVFQKIEFFFGAPRGADALPLPPPPAVARTDGG